MQSDSLPAEPQGKPKNTGVGSLSLLQGIFPTQESNRDLPALQVDSLPTELSGKSQFSLINWIKALLMVSTLYVLWNTNLVV